MDIIYRSSSTANAYPLSIQSKWIRYQDVVFEPDYIESLCKKGCRNYGHSGGCPPFSPKFNQFANDDKQYLLIITKFDSKYKTIKVKASKNRANHWAALAKNALINSKNPVAILISVLFPWNRQEST